MKAILMSIKPKYVSMILNQIKTIEVRKRFPSDYVGWVYIYNTKDIKDGYLTNAYIGDKLEFITSFNKHEKYRGKVVARFWCDKVEKIRSYLEPEQWYMTSDLGGSGLLQKSCLTFKELDDYLLSGEGYAIYITKLEIFDKPKEISEFKRYINDSDCKKCAYGSRCSLYPCDKIPLTRVPQSWQFIEV